MQMLPQVYQTCFLASLSATQFLTLEILVWLLQAHKQVRIERLAALFPQPIQFESRRRRLQRFLVLPLISIPVLWFPIIKYILRTHFNQKSSQLILAIDRTQWRDKNLFMVSVIWEKRSWPIYWKLLDKKGSSNFTEQKALLRPVLTLLKGYEVVVLGDREKRKCPASSLAGRSGCILRFTAKKIYLYSTTRSRLSAAQFSRVSSWYEAVFNWSASHQAKRLSPV